MIAETRPVKKATPTPPPLSVMGIPVVPFETYDQALDCIGEAIESNRKSFCVAINPIKAYNALRDPELQDLLQQADINICDGVGISIASRILHGRGINRITGCDLFFRLLALASEKQWGIYLLGASPQSNAAACSQLQKMHPRLRIDISRIHARSSSTSTPARRTCCSWRWDRQSRNTGSGVIGERSMRASAWAWGEVSTSRPVISKGRQRCSA